MLRNVPATYLGILSIKEPADTFIRLDGWYKVRTVENYGFHKKLSNNIFKPYK